MKFNLTEYLLKQHIETRANHIAVLLVDDIGRHRAVTYQTLYQDVCCLMTGLKNLGLPKGTIICIQADDVYDLLLLFLAGIAANFVPTLLLLSLSTDEIEYILKNSNAHAFFCLTASKNRLQIPAHCQVIMTDEYKNLKNYPFQEMHATTTANEPAFIFYTSGSSGHPKGVLHAQRAILGRKPSLENWLTLTADDIVMQTDNLCWTYSMFTGFLDPLMVGATAVVITASNCSSKAEDKISAEKWLNLIDYYEVSVMASTPDFYSKMMTSQFIKKFINRSLRQAGSAGAFLADEIQQLWTAHFHFPIFIALGMSELSTFISTGPQVPYHANRLGKIQPGRKVDILPIQDGFEHVPTNEQGMLAVHRDELGLMLNYVGQKKNDKCKYRGDWFLTQDIVSMDVNGYIQYYGRADSLIKVDGGFRVSPIEIENELKNHDDVLDAACGTILDTKAGCARLVLYIVVKKPNQEVAEDIYQFLLKHLTDYKVPNYFYFVDHLPLNSRGKFIRDELSTLLPLQKYQVINSIIERI